MIRTQTISDSLIREAILLNATIQQIIQRSFDSMVTLARRCIHAEGHAFPDE